VSREVFVDTSAWIAVSDARDKYHAPAEESYRQLIAERRILVTTNLVVAETYIIIRRTGGHAQALRMLHSMRGSPRLIKIWSDARLEALAEQILKRHTDQGFSFTDAVSFMVMQAREITVAFTFDGHFASIGFHMIPGQGG